jgi:hypothetical protein
MRNSYKHKQIFLHFWQGKLSCIANMMRPPFSGGKKYFLQSLLYLMLWSPPTTFTVLPSPLLNSIRNVLWQNLLYCTLRFIIFCYHLIENSILKLRLMPHWQEAIDPLPETAPSGERRLKLCTEGTGPRLQPDCTLLQPDCKQTAPDCNQTALACTRLQKVATTWPRKSCIG